MHTPVCLRKRSGELSVLNPDTFSAQCLEIIPTIICVLRNSAGEVPLELMELTSTAEVVSDGCRIFALYLSCISKVVKMSCRWKRPHAVMLCTKPQVCLRAASSRVITANHSSTVSVLTGTR